MSALYAEIRGAISYVYEQNVEYLDILFGAVLLRCIISLKENLLLKILRILFTGTQVITVMCLLQTES